MPTWWWAEHAWLGGPGTTPGVLIEVDDGRIRALTAGAPRPAGAITPAGVTPAVVILPGVTLPGLVNAHSHAFHRALRGRTNTGRGSFWTWREQMYAVAGRLTPDGYRALARATYAEMALAGITTVAEFHYLHHGPDGVPYADPNAMGHALVDAAAAAGIRLTLLDTCYLTAAPDGSPLQGTQRRFGDRGVEGWAERATALHERYSDDPVVRVGAAVHSVRAVPPAAIAEVARWATERHVPLHAHVSEQPAENEACLRAHGVTPTRLLADAGALGPRTTAVHATHLTDDDIALLGAAGATVCLCPSTERDLADGIGPAPALVRHGSPLALGSDSQAVIDLLEEARAVELDERLGSGVRGHWTAAELATAACATAGLLVGAPADLTTIGLDSVRTADAHPDSLLETVLFAAGAADVRSVVVGGRRIVEDGRHLLVGDVPAALRAAVGEALR